MSETAIATGLAALISGIIVFGTRLKRASMLLPALLLVLYLADVWRVNDKFMFLTDAPVKAKAGEASPLMAFLKAMPQTYRILPFDGSDPMQYISRGIPVMFTSNPVQQQRWQQFLDGLNVMSPMIDVINVKYMIMANDEYQKQKELLGLKFVPAFTSPDNATLVLENRTVLPKGWLVSSAAVITDANQRLAILQSPTFNPLMVAMVESPPPIALVDPARAVTLPQSVTTTVYENDRISLTASTKQNALLVLGEKYYKGWKATVDGKFTEIIPVDHILRGVYLTPGEHKVEFFFDPLPFKIGKYLTLVSFAVFAGMLIRELLLRCKRVKSVSKAEGMEQRC